MRWVASFAVLLLAAACVAAIDVGRPSLLCGDLTRPAGVLRVGTQFSAAVHCRETDVLVCHCVLHVNKTVLNDYVAPPAKTVIGPACTCVFTAAQDTPEDMLSANACALCAGR